MKLITHYIFTAGVMTAIAAFFARYLSSDEVILFALLTLFQSWMVNLIVDRVGHVHKMTRYGNIPVRMWWTHDILTAPFWGALVGGLLSLGLWYISREVQVPATQGLMYLTVLIGAIAAYTHLFADSFTQAGVFFAMKRKAFAHWRYDNPLANLLFIGIGLLLLYLFLPGLFGTAISL